MKHEMKFDAPGVEALCSGEKWSTVREPDWYDDLSPGDTVELFTDDNEAFGTATVNRITLIRADAYADWDPDGHRSYRDAGELLDDLRGYYPDQEWRPDSMVCSVRFIDVVATHPNEQFRDPPEEVREERER